MRRAQDDYGSASHSVLGALEVRPSTSPVWRCGGVGVLGDAGPRHLWVVQKNPPWLH